jgi:uncharacterized membrane protein
VWHYRATDEERTFTVSYRLEDLAVAHNDVVDLYWQVWGEEWQEPLESLDAAVVLPGDASKGEVKVFGHPASVSGETSLGPDGVSPKLVASDVPAEQYVEMRVVFPRELLASTGGARLEPGDGLKEIMAEEEAEARSEAREARQTRLLWLFGVLGIGLVGAVIMTMSFGYVYWGWSFGGLGGGGDGGGGGVHRTRRRRRRRRRCWSMVAPASSQPGAVALVKHPTLSALQPAVS